MNHFHSAVHHLQMVIFLRKQNVTLSNYSWFVMKVFLEITFFNRFVSEELGLSRTRGMRHRPIRESLSLRLPRVLRRRWIQLSTRTW